MSERQASTPYVGPTFFTRTEEDQKRFFGRDRETKEIVSLIYGHPLLLVYAQSGAGKTSLFNAKIAPTLEKRGFQVLPIARVYGALPEGADPLALKNPYLTNLLLWLEPETDEGTPSGEPDPAGPVALPDRSLADYLAQYPRPLARRGNRPRPRVLVIDQFEELFTHYPVGQREHQDAFFDQIVAALKADELLRCVFVIREDYVAQLDPFARRLAEAEELRIRYRVERLREPAALAAVKEPLAAVEEPLAGVEEPLAATKEPPAGTKRSFAPGVAEALVKELLQTRVEVGADRTEVVEGEFVEPVQLQVVCQRLWMSLPDEVETITHDHLERYADVDQALEDFYDRSLRTTEQETGVPEGELRLWFESALITPAGTRGTVYRGTDETGGLDNAAVDALQNLHLIRGEQRSGSRWYELTHDSFVEPIQASNRKWQGAQEESTKLGLRLQERANAWRADRSRERLLKPAELPEAEGWMARMEATGQPVNTAVLAWIQASRNRQSAVRRTRVTLAVAALLVVAIVGAALGFGFAVMQRRIAQAAVAEAKAAGTAAATAATEAVVAQQTAAVDRDRADDAKTQAAVDQRTAVAAQQVAATAATEAVAAQQTAAADRDRADDAIAQADVDQRRAVAAQQAAAAAATEAAVAQLTATVAVGAAQAAEQSAAAAQARALAEQQRAERQLLESNARALAVAALNSLSADPELGILLGIEAVSIGVAQDEPATAQALNALHQAIGTSRTELTLTGHISAVHGVAFSPDGTRLATSGEDGTVRLWDALSGDELSTVVRLDDPAVVDVYDVAFDAGGTRLAAASKDGRARVWEVIGTTGLTAGESPVTFRGHAAPVRSVAFAPDGEGLLTTATDNSAIWWDAETGAEELDFRHGTTPWNAAIHPGGELFVTAAEDGKVRAWDVESGDLLFQFPAHDQAVWDVAFSPDGKRLVTAGMDGRAKIWDTEFFTDTPPLQLELIGHRAGVRCVALSPDGTQVATGSFDRTIRIWDAELGQETLVLPGHTATVVDLAFNQEGTRLASASEDGTARVWNLGLTRELLTWPADEGEVNVVVYGPDGRVLLSGGDQGTILIWDAETGQERESLAGHADSVMALSLAAGGTRLASAGWDGTAQVWEQRDGAWQRGTLSLNHSERIYDAVLYPSASGLYLATTGVDFMARTWDVASGAELQPLRDQATAGHSSHRNLVTGIAASQDGKTLATCSYDQTAKLWDAETGELRHTLAGHGQNVWDVALSPDGTLLATGDTHGTVKLWDVETGDEGHTLWGHSSRVRQISFSPDGTLVATAGFDGLTKVWEVETGRELLSLIGQTGRVRSVAFSPDGRRLASGGGDGTIRLYTLDVSELMTLACSRVTRDLASAERATYLPDQPDRQTCREGVPWVLE